LATDIYKTVLDKMTQHYVNIPMSQKCDFASKILTCLKERGITIEDNVFEKVTRMIYKNQGGKFNNYNSSQSNFNNNSYEGGNRKDHNKDQLKWQRKNYK